MDQASLFAALVVCSVIHAAYWALYSLDATGWIGGVMGFALAFVGFAVVRYVAMYLSQESLYPSLSLVFWGAYFLEHFVESILWNCLGSIVRARYGRRVDYRKDVIDAVLRLCLITAGFCFVMLLTLLFAHDPDRSVVVLRQISLMLTICSAVAEYTTVAVYGSLLRDARMILSNRAMVLVMAPPCLSLGVSLGVCGVPELVEGASCLAFELVHLLVLTGTIAALWYHALLRGALCSRRGPHHPEACLTLRPGWTTAAPVALRL